MAPSYEAVCKQYGLIPVRVDSFGQVQRIWTEQGTFALKKIPAERGIDFLLHMQSLYQAGYHHFVPVYPTLDGRYSVLEGSSLYYLMPWIEGQHENARQVERSLLREAARLHLLSAVEVRVSKEERLRQFEKTKSRWERQEEELEQLAFLAEEEVYMSPFHLLFCSYYEETRLAYRYAKEKLEAWKEETAESEKERTVQIHGQLEPGHYVTDAQSRGYFINLEQSRRATPIHDLVPYFNRLFAGYPKESKQEVESFQHYTQFFSLKKGEKLLFQSYLAYPGQVYQAVASYFSGQGRQSEYEMVHKLQQAYWQMKNIEYFVTQLD
ncbi:spore coat protein YsxE [Bacillus thermotolerans]|uniref:CotS-related protein n=1 Tax=Bacillus thermotolerans TaxID=1221996 RepID=A0A0F5ID02_BACTR|nr:spore coat protein YsxE [Bacillus thermotolerans]KKB43396.1 CotS-related protein [Bacillus thermotolerans]